jgi:hypothetical protein
VAFTWLIPTVKQMGHAVVGTDVLYIVDGQIPGKTLNITVTALAGDPDIYVVAGAVTPGPTNYMWRSVNFGSDSVVITAADPTWQSNCSGGCSLRIAVIGFVESTFSIVVTYS